MRFERVKNQQITRHRRWQRCSLCFAAISVLLLLQQLQCSNATNDTTITTITTSDGTTIFEDNRLIELLSDVRDDGSLYTGIFAGATIFGCNNNSNAALGVRLLRRLSAVFLPSSLLDVQTHVHRLAELAWARGYEGQDLPLEAHQQLFVLEMNCPGVEEFISRVNAEEMFAAPFKWLLITGSDTKADTKMEQLIFSIINHASLYPDSEVTIWDLESDRLLSVYQTNPNSSYIIERRGFWSPTTRLHVQDRNATSRRRKNLAGTRLKSCLVVQYYFSTYLLAHRVTVPILEGLRSTFGLNRLSLKITHSDTINHLTDYQDRHIDSITKCNYPWAIKLVDMLNATVSFETANTWGYENPNGSWGGMIGMLQRKEIDFGGTGTFLLRKRIGVIRYISLSTPTGSRFIFRSPPLSSTANLFRLPFGTSVWLVICILMLLLIVMLYPAMRQEWFEWKDRKDHMLEPRLPNLSDDLLVIVGAVSQQGSWYEPRSVSTRIIVLMALLAAVILYSAYTANIVALLTSSSRSIRTLRDLLDSPLTLAAHDNVFNRYYFSSFRDPVRQAIFQERIQPPRRPDNWLEIEDGVERMRHGYFAFHVEPGCAYKIVQETYEEDEKCGFQEIDFLNVFDPHFVVQRRSPYLELLKVGALRLHESGLRTRELNRLYTKKPVCDSSSGSRRFLSVGLAECYGAFSALLIGLLLSLAIFLVEHLVACRIFRFCNNPKRESPKRQHWSSRNFSSVTIGNLQHLEAHEK